MVIGHKKLSPQAFKVAQLALNRPTWSHWHSFKREICEKDFEWGEKRMF